MKEHGFVGINLPANVADKIKQTRRRIDSDDLAPKQDKYAPHITVCWGILDDDPQKLWQATVQLMPFFVRLGTTRLFPPSESSDGAAVLYVEAYGPNLRASHEAIQAAVPTKPSEHPYSAHTTLAYLKPEAAYKYENLPLLDGVEFIVDYLDVTGKDEITRRIKMFPYRVE